MEWIESEPGGHEIEPEEVHLWRFPLAAPDNSDGAVNLPEEERRCAEAMQSPTARRSFVAGQSALRALLSSYTGTPAGEIAFSRAAHGKPMLASPVAPLEFNVSHSGDWGVIALARVPVGVDVEQIRPGRSSPALERRFLTESERALLGRRARADGDAAFFVVWCRKEAYLKATGFGLAAPFSRIDSSAARLPDLHESGAQLAGDTPWSVAEFFVDERHAAAVVARADRLSPRFFTLRRSR
ncbi:MAG: 4'-phosphopantetheinyl transferase superfamily protein [Gemmatimonadaceae bacterium]